MIKRNNMRMTALSMAVGLALLTGCGAQTIVQPNNEGTVNSTEAESLTTNVNTESSDIKVEYADDDYYTAWSKEEATQITLSGNSISANGNGVQANGSTVTINSGGTYVISGQLSDGQIIVDSQDKNVVRIVLNGAEIHSSTSSPIYVKQAKKVVLSLEEGTNNKISDNAEYVLEEGTDKPDAAIFSKDDLTINGTGTLSIEANYNDGITSKDELKIMEGNITVKAAGDGIKGKDMLAIKDGNININALQDGMKSTNAIDSTKGYIYIEAGVFNINAGNDGIQAETDIKVIDGEFHLNTGGGNSNGKAHSEGFGGGMKPDRGGMTAPADAGMTRPENEGTTAPADAGMTKPENEGTTAPADAGMTRPENEGTTAPADAGMTKPENEGVTAPSAVEQTPTEGTSSTSDNTSGNSSDTTEGTSDSYKGIKATNIITIEGGSFEIDSADDALHTNNSMIINNGEFTILSGDDGIHADTALAINGGTININKSYEGLEAADISVTGGEVYVTSSDDGVNATDGTSTETMGGRPGESAGSAKLTISGGYLYVDASGDGLDSNGSIYMTDGTVIVNGPVNGGNGALDYDSTFEISGGTMIAAGSSQMAQTTSTSSSQKAVAMTFSSNQEAGSTIALLDGAGNTVLSFSPSKTYQAVVISSPLLEEGKTYSFSYGGTVTGAETNGLSNEGTYSGGTKVTDFTISDAVTYLSESGVTTGGSGFGQGGGMQQGGGKGNRGDRPFGTETSPSSGAAAQDSTTTSA